MADRHIPTAVYRVQMHAGMPFHEAQKLVPYLHDLGISDFYSSPILQARRGSTHGYDVTDPTRINPELGTEEDFELLARELQGHGMGLLLDIVPNHLAASSESPWWMDVLEEGPASVYSAYFDVDWHPPSRSLENRLLLPILARPYAQVLEGSELNLEFDGGSFFIRHFDMRLPVALRSYRLIIDLGFDSLRNQLGADAPAFLELEGIRSEIDRMPPRATLLAEKAGERRLQRTGLKERLSRLYANSPEIRAFIDGNVTVFNGQPGSPESFTNLDRLLNLQTYVLSYWKNTNQSINYRRFFTIMDLIGVRVEDPVTFDAIHSVILRLADKKLVTGMRIDHIDGLRDPDGYLIRLQERLAGDRTKNGDSKPDSFYVVVEKILGHNEPLPDEWPVAGTTGYDFLNYVNGLFVNGSNMQHLERIYHDFSDLKTPFSDLVYEKKKQVMSNLLAVEMYALGRHLTLLAEQDRYARELSRSCLTEALIESIACLSIYRTYIRGSQPGEMESKYISDAIDEAQQRNPHLDRACIEFLRQVLLQQAGPVVLPEQREAWLAFIMRWQQFTGPIMAKAFEDSMLYVFNRLVSLNEVGGAPNLPGVSPDELHHFGLQRQRRWPLALNATTTHDTKRSEDVRARISVLSEMPDEWERKLANWHSVNQKYRSNVMGHPVPTPNEEVLLYQTLLGAWPLEESELEHFPKRIEEYMIKAIREAMVHTKWTVPNVAHEAAITNFVRAILSPLPDNEFLPDFLAFLPRIAFQGALNGLSQTLIKITFPGVPDFYQGSELWDLRLVDPDNRGPIDFTQRMSALESMRKSSRSIPDLLNHWQDGRIKLHVIARALCFRRTNSDLFANGEYIPLEVSGQQKDHTFAFARRLQDRWSLVITPRLAADLTHPDHFPLGEVWTDTAVQLPQSAPTNWHNIFHPESTETSENGMLKLSQVLKSFPIALLTA